MRPHAFILTLALAACTHAPDPQDATDFVDTRALIPDLVVEMRYAGHENFVGRPITGYDDPVCLLTQRAAAALANAQKVLGESGLGLKVFDCYRPTRAVADFAAWARDPQDQARKADYYPNVDKSQLFALGYIAERSGHSRGSTLDITLIDLTTRAEVDMGSAYDLFDTRSAPRSATRAEPPPPGRALAPSAAPRPARAPRTGAAPRQARAARQPPDAAVRDDRQRLPSARRRMVALHAQRRAFPGNLFRFPGGAALYFPSMSLRAR